LKLAFCDPAAICIEIISEFSHKLK
jgi:hypothetical protein